MQPSRKTYITIIVGAVVALVPPILLYAQSRAELREKYRESNDEADAGYKTLVESVQELRTTVQRQHEAIIKIQGYLDAVSAFVPSMRMTTRPTIALPKPAFDELPPDLPAAQAAAK